MANLSTSRKSIKNKTNSLKRNSPSIDATGPLMTPKAPELPTKKSFKTSVKKSWKICTTATMPPSLHMAKPVLVSPVPLRVFLGSSQKVCYNCVWKTSSAASRKISQRGLQPQWEWLTWKFTTRSWKTCFRKTQKITKWKWKPWQKLTSSFTPKVPTEKHLSNWCPNCAKRMSKWKSFFISVNLSESSALLKWIRTLPEVMLSSQFTTLKREAASNWIANTISSIWLVPNVLIEQEPLVTGPRKAPPLTRVCLLWAESSTFLLIIVPRENKSSCLTESQS